MPVAYAEGGWSSYMTGVLTGFNSRTWQDQNIDSTSTSITFSGCTNNINPYHGVNAEVQLTRETPFYQPDESQGRRSLNCGGSDTKYWGRFPAGSYHFTLTGVNGSKYGAISVRNVGVNY